MADRLQPVGRAQFAAEMIACLTLVAPVGMTEEARREWLRVAHATVGHLPLDLLRAGCEEARKHADHPAKIVPCILRVAEPLLKSRREPDPYRVPPSHQLESPAIVSRDDIQAILRKFGHRDVAEKIANPEPVKRERPPLRKPTAEDYRAMGVPDEHIPGDKI